MAIITLQVDTSQAKSALNSVNNAITQIKVNGATISIGGQQVKGQLKEISNGAKEAGKNIQKVSKDTSKDAIKGIKATTKQFKQSTGILKSLTAGVVSWWTAIIIAIEMATKAGVYFFENLTESIPKLNARMDNLNNNMKKNFQSWKEQKKTADQYNKSLGELAEKQSLTNTEQVLAQALIDKLNQKYKGLNITIDETTKKIKGYSEAVKIMNQQDLEQNQKLLQAQIDAKKEQVDAKLAETFGNDRIKLYGHINADDMFTNAQNWFGDINSLQREQMSKAWNGGDLNAKLKILKDLSTRYSNNQNIIKSLNGPIQAIEELIKLQKDYNDLVDAGNIRLNTAKEILVKEAEVTQKIKELNDDSDKIMKSIADDQQQVYFDSLGTEQDKIDYLQKKIDDLKAQEEALNTKVGQAQSRDNKADELKATSDSITKQITQSKKALRQVKDAMKNIRRDFQKQSGHALRTVPQINKEIAEANRIIAADPKRHGNGIIGAVVDSAARTNAQKNKSALLQELAIAQKVSNLQAKEVALDKEIKSLTAKLRQNEAKYKEEVEGGLQNQQELADLKNQQAKIAKEIYDKEKQQDELRDQIAAKQLKDLEEQKKARKKAADAEAELAAKRKQINDNYFQNGKNNLAEQYLKLIGKQKEALILEQKINLARALGLKSIKELTAAQVKGITRQVEMQMKLDQLSQMNVSGIEKPNIISNELAKKGGFASSVVVERNNVNKQILSAEQQQVNLQNAIKNEISKYGVIS